MVGGRRRSRGAQATARADALERLRALRSGGRRSTDGSGSFQIKMEDRIYDTVDDDEYEALVAKRREEAKGFIVDDDGLGYGDEGQEEDWSLAGALSSEESEGEPDRPKRKKNNSNKSNLEKKEQQTTKKPSALSAAAALMGKQSISNLFTSSVFKKNKDDSKAKNLSCDSIIDGVLAEFAPDEGDRERRRRRGNSNLLSNLKNFDPVNSYVGAITAEKPVNHGITSSVTHESSGFNDTTCEPLMSDSTKGDFHVEKDFPKESSNEYTSNHETEDAKILDRSNSSSKEIGDGKNLSNAVEVQGEPVAKVEEEKAFKLNATIKQERDPALSATAGWQAVRNTRNGIVISSDSGGEKSDFKLDCDGSLPFYILDVHEELFGANAGNLYLFGKVYRSFISSVLVSSFPTLIFKLKSLFYT